MAIKRECSNCYTYESINDTRGFCQLKPPRCVRPELALTIEGWAQPMVYSDMCCGGWSKEVVVDDVVPSLDELDAEDNLATMLGED